MTMSGFHRALSTKAVQPTHNRTSGGSSPSEPTNYPGGTNVKKTAPLLHRFTKLVPSEVDLYPCLADGYARISVMPLTNGAWRVYVWGADDYGAEFDVATLEEALAVFNDTDWYYRLPNGWCLV